MIEAIIETLIALESNIDLLSHLNTADQPKNLNISQLNTNIHKQLKGQVEELFRIVEEIKR